MAKKIDIKFNLDSKSVNIAGEETMRLTQQVRILKAELASGKYSQEEFDILSTKLDDVQDQMEKTKLRTGDLFTTLQLLPGPIGEISSKFNGAIALLNSFTDFSFADLQTQFKKTIDDVTDIGSALGRNLGITQTYTRLTDFLTQKFIGLGAAQNAAATSARAFAGALTATGIGAIVVALGLLIANWDKVVDAIKGATAESKAYDEAQVEVTKNLADFNKKLFDVKAAFAQAKAGAISKEDALKKYNDELGKSVGFAGSLEQAEQLLADNTKVVVEGIKLRTQANVFYAKSAEAAAKAVSGEDLDPTTWQTIGDYIQSGGQYLAFTNRQFESYAQNLEETKKNVEIFAAEGDKLTQQAIENDSKLKKGLETPPNTTKTKEAVKSTLDETKKAIEDARLFLMDEQKREEAIVAEKYRNLIEQAKINGLETKTLMDAQAKEEQAIKDKYQKIDDDKKKQQLLKEQGFQNDLDRINAQKTDTLKDDTELEVQLANQKYDALIAAAKANNEETITLEALKVAEVERIRREGDQKEIDRLNNNAAKTKQENLAALEQERALEQQRLSIKMETLDGIIALTNEETIVGKAALIAKQVLLAKELILEVQKTIAFSQGALARSQVAVAEGTAQTAKVGFPQNIPLLALYAVQAATIISTIIKAVTRTKRAGTDLDTGGGGATPTPAGGTAQPIQVIARRNQGGFVYGQGGSITDSIPSMLSNGEFVMNARSADMFSPILTAMNNMGSMPNISVPQSSSSQSLIDLVQGQRDSRPVRTFVVAQDMSNQQQFDRTIKTRSLI
jgi:hypothetical protein